MKQQSDVIAWLAENLQRLKQTSPKFWKVWTRINTAMLLIAGLPTLLSVMDISDLNQYLPHGVVKIVLKIVAFAAGYGLLQNKLTVKDSHDVVTDGDIFIQKTSDKLPFTQKKEASKIIYPTIQ